jgi:GrpB-like predicted nucleotidyltransferase (UPF0157 family)
VTLGLGDNAVSLHPYTPEWADAGHRECQLLRDALTRWALQVEHIGSTAVPGLASKPIIDICVGVADLGDADEMADVMSSLGYDYPGDVGIPDDRVFGRDPGWRTHLVHVVVHGSERWHAYLCFRDFLRSDEALRSQYEELKRELASTHGGDRYAYTQLKTAFIEAVLQQT